MPFCYSRHQSNILQRMNFEDSINHSVELENRSPQSTRLFTKIAMFASISALLLFFVCIICYKINETLGLNMFSSVIVPMGVLLLISAYLAITERLRAKYLGSIIALMVMAVTVLCVVGFMIFELITYDVIFLAPFNPPPKFTL